MNRQSLQWERMLPEEFRMAMKHNPVVYLPLGTVEWHGEHNALGLDALKAHELCVLAANKAGGIVHPPLYGGMGGLDKPATIIMESEMSWENVLLRPWLERLCMEFHRIGFRAIVMLTGHYGHNQQIVVRETAVRMSERLQIPVLGTPEYWLALDRGYHGDHAGIGETSLLMHLHPELVKLERIIDDPDYGKDDTIRNGSSADLGQAYTDLITKRLAMLARRMPDWTSETLQSFVEAERSIVSAQVRAWRQSGNPWMAWGRMFQGKVSEYGNLLENEDFKGILSWSGTLK